MSGQNLRVPATSVTLPQGAWLAVAFLWMAGGSNYLTRTMLTTMRGSIVGDIPMSDAQFGLLTTGFLWIYAVASPFGGYIADRFSRRLVVIWSVVAWSVLTLLTLLADSFGSFLVARALLGLAQAFYIPAAGALIIDMHRGSTRALAGGIHITGMVVGSMVGGVGGWLAEMHGWRYAYAVVGGPSLLLGLLLCFGLRDAPRDPGEGETSKPAGPPSKVGVGEALRSLAQPGPYAVMFACLAIQGGVSWLIIGWMPTIMREQFNLGQATAGLSALAFLYVSQTTGLLIGGFTSDRLAARNPRSRIFLPAVAILVAVPAFWLLVAGPRFDLSLVCLSLWGAAMGILGANLMPIVCLIVDARFRATAIGTLNCVTAICGGLTIYGVGALRDAEVQVPAILAIVAAGATLTGVLLWMVGVSARRRQRVAAAV